MTVLVGIRCRDGVVIGSDSAKTAGTGDGVPTISAVGSKIDIVDQKVVIAHTGQVGMGQRFTDVIKTGWSKGSFKGMSAMDMARQMSALAGKDFQQTGALRGEYGALVGYHGKDGPALCEFAVKDFQPELKTDLWYCSMGSGQSVVDPLFGLFRKAFWAEGPPALQDGIFAAVWALSLAVEFCPAFVSGPIRIAAHDGKQSRLLDDDEIAPHMENAEQAVAYFGTYAERLSGNATDTPDIPRQAVATKDEGEVE